METVIGIIASAGLSLINLEIIKRYGYKKADSIDDWKGTYDNSVFLNLRM